MKPNIGAILLLFFLPLGILAQENGNASTYMFYTQLAVKDALYEHSLKELDIEDQEDYWEDQEAYEMALRKQDFWAYKTYLKAKQLAYKKHREACGVDCGHSDLFYRKASYYAINGSGQVSEKNIFIEVGTSH